MLNQFDHNSEDETSALFFFLLLYCPYEKKCAYVLTPWHFFCCDSFILVGWEHDSVENIVLCQPQELFSDLNLTLRSGHLGVVRNASCLCGKKCSDAVPGLKYNS